MGSLKARVQFNSGLFVQFCENQTAVAGLSPTITIEVSASVENLMRG